MTVKRRELIRHLEENGFAMRREGARHSIYAKGSVMVPVKRHAYIDNITANKICKQAGVKEIF